MAVTKYFFDTYAFFEFAAGNPKYKKYFVEFEIVTTLLNLIELFYVLLREYNIEIARKYYNTFLPFIFDISNGIIEQAMLFKLKHKKRDFSYADCIGYVFALDRNLKFLTGDKKFKGLRNVEFVK